MDNALAAAQSNIADLQSTTAALKERVDAISGLLNVLLAALTALLALGGLTSFVSWYRNETRQSQSFAVGLAGEVAREGRAAQTHESLLASSQQTLTLVNGTLQLAMDASNRAANAIQLKAKETLHHLDLAARTLFAKVPVADDRAIVADQERRTEVTSIAHRIDAFNLNRFILPEDLPLTPSCTFLWGMQQHLDQHFDEAFEAWHGVALDDAAPQALRSSAWFWIGYERNNLGQFAEAERDFEKARQLAQGARAYELRRIQLETRFFNKTRERAADLIQPFKDLLRAIDAEESDEHIAQTRLRILSTLGNVCHVAGDDARRSKDDNRAHDHYTAARDYFKLAEPGRGWAPFGLAEASYRLEEYEFAASLFREAVRDHAVDEFLHRVEPRTKVLARTTELICCLRASPKDVPTAYNNVLEALVKVEDRRLTVYSQVQRRNVTQDEFQTDLKEVMKERSRAITTPSGRKGAGRSARAPVTGAG